MRRADAVARVADRIHQGALTIACNGMIGRELYTHRDLPSQFYMIGSMGLASSIALDTSEPSRRPMRLWRIRNWTNFLSLED